MLIRPSVLPLVVACFVAALFTATSGPRYASADEDWVIRSLDVHYVIDESGIVTVTEDIVVDFGALQRHGIFRDIPVEYEYDDESNRLIQIVGLGVDDGAVPIRFTTSRIGGTLQIKIGDPNRLVTGEQRYVITYSIAGALNAFEDHDELFWNVTGNDWPVLIEKASATVDVPGPGIQRVTCFQGPTGSTAPCTSSSDESKATFTSTTPLPAGSGLTLVVALEKGVAEVLPPLLAPVVKGTWEQWSDLLGLNPLGIALATLVAAIVLGLLLWMWWIVGRDRWFGDMYYLSESPQAETKPLFVRETVVVEFQPPKILGDGRRLRPAEVGLLLDERADTLDVSATIVDLAVRKFILIKELATDHELTKLPGTEKELLPYERALIEALFGDKSTVRLSTLKGEFHGKLRNVKDHLYQEAVRAHKFFPQDPEVVRRDHRRLGGVITALGFFGFFGLGLGLGLGLIAIPIFVAGLALLVLAPAMPRRTARGWETYRRCLGFRLYMVTAEQDRQRFAEEANIFDEYLPYAIVFHCARKWALAFEGLGLEKRQVDWYVGRTPFVPLHFALSVRDFSSSVSGAMSTAPASSGGSGSWAGGFSGGGFSGGGFSGGGGGGGGGGSW